MTTYQEIKSNYQKTSDGLVDKYKVFFAFSNEQFKEAITKLEKDGEIEPGAKKIIIDIGMGGFILKKYVKQYNEATDKAYNDYRKQVKALRDNKKETEKAILYELNNHEAFYTGRLDEVIEKFDGIYTAEAIRATYKKFINQY
jgi:transposase